MRTEIRLSASSTSTNSVYVWRVWDQGQIVGQGTSSSEEAAAEAGRLLMGASGPSHAERPARRQRPQF